MEQNVKMKVLYVEDEDDIRDIVVTTLEHLGNFTVKPCASGTEALKVAVDFQPDLILLDVMMPGMDGPSILRAFNKMPELKNIPTIFITAKVQANEIQEYSTMGVIDIIKKPFDVVELAKLITNHVQKHKMKKS